MSSLIIIGMAHFHFDLDDFIVFYSALINVIVLVKRDSLCKN